MKQRQTYYMTRLPQHLYYLAFIKAIRQTTVEILTLLKEKLYFVVTYCRELFLVTPIT
jgi:hypothetical protein